MTDKTLTEIGAGYEKVAVGGPIGSDTNGHDVDDDDLIDDLLLDDDDPAPGDGPGPGTSGNADADKADWIVLIVDDEADVHAVTRLALAGVRYRGRGVQFLSAYSAAEGQAILSNIPDVAMILLDVVMETDHAGLDLVKWTREHLANHFVRIVLRTGQPGIAPERQVIEDYDINDYQAKAQLTHERLFTVLMGGLRNYQDLKTIEASRRMIDANRKGLRRIIDASSTLFRSQSVDRFANGVLEQMRGLIVADNRMPEDLGDDGSANGLAAFAGLSGPQVIAGLGRYADSRGLPLDQAMDSAVTEAVHHAIASHASTVVGNHYIGVMDDRGGRTSVLVVEDRSGAITRADRQLLDLFCCNVGIAYDNLTLRDEIEATQRDIIYHLGEVVETRSKETGNHVRRVAEYSYILALASGCSDEEAQIVRVASPLHDIGKVGIADAVLLKPGRFTDEERLIMNTHARIGYEMLKSANSRALQAGAIIAYEHHEKWDGTGYPRGLAGEEIHLYGRITAIADVFDALGSARVYKPAWELPRIEALLRDERGKHFDPKLVDLFFENFDHIDAVRRRHADA